MAFSGKTSIALKGFIYIKTAEVNPSYESVEQYSGGERAWLLSVCTRLTGDAIPAEV